MKSELATIDKLQEERQEIVTKLEEELQCVKRQEMDKHEKLNRANCNLKKLVKKLEKHDISNYEVIMRNLKLFFWYFFAYFISKIVKS